MKKLITLFVGLAVVLFALPSFAQEPDVTKTSWGALKVHFVDPPSSASTTETGRAIAKPGAELSVANYSIRIKPYFVNEFWLDPNNHGSGSHVVMYYRFNTNMTRGIKLRLYQGGEYTWLNNWNYRVRYPAPGVQEVMLFADGHFWWPQRFFYSAWTISQRFELCF